MSWITSCSSNIQSCICCKWLRNFGIIKFKWHYCSWSTLHKDCYKTYVTRKVIGDVEQNLDAYKTVELDSFTKVVKYCLTLDLKPHILKFKDLLKEMEKNIKSENHEIRQSTRLYLQRNLEKLDILKFITINCRKYVYHKSMKIEDLMKMYVDLQNKLE